MTDSHKARMLSNTRAALPSTVRQAVHDLTQPLQALRMMLGLPGVVIDDARGLPQKIENALEELDMQLDQLHTLARVLDGGGVPPGERTPFASVLQTAQNQSPALWAMGGAQRKADLRIYGGDYPVSLPSGNAAWVLNVLLDQAWRARPASRVIVGYRTYGNWVIVADDGDGMSQAVAQAMENALNGLVTEGDPVTLSSGLLLARLMVSGWNGAWRVIAQPGQGTVMAFSVPDDGEM